MNKIQINNPICTDYGNLELAFYGSFVPIPDVAKFKNRDKIENGNDVIMDEQEKPNDKNANSLSKTDHVINESEFCPGKIIPLKHASDSKTSNQQIEDENLDEGEIVEVQPVENQANSNKTQNSDIIEINKQKLNQIVYLNVQNLSNQKIKVKIGKNSSCFVICGKRYLI